MGLSTVVLAGVIQTYLTLTKSGLNVGSYAVMEAEARRAIETAAQDFRMASSVYFNHAESVTLTIPENYATYGNQVTYAYDNATTGPTAGCFYMQPGDYLSTATKTILLRNVVQLEFHRFDRLNLETTSSSNAQRIDLRITASMTPGNRAASSNHIVAASFMLRNKLSH
jgi:hypothetical protein